MINYLNVYNNKKKDYIRLCSIFKKSNTVSYIIQNQKGGSIKIDLETGYSDLDLLIINNKLDDIKQLLTIENNLFMINYRNIYTGYTPLILAIKLSNITVIDLDWFYISTSLKIK